MTLLNEVRDMALGLASRYAIPKLAGIVFPPYFAQGQPKDCEFMALALEGGAGGVSYVMLPEEDADEYRSLEPHSFAGSHPEAYAEAVGESGPVQTMLGLAAINAICQQVMRLLQVNPGAATDSLGLMNIEDGDRVGMVGFFPPLLKYMQNKKAELVIIEKDERLVDRYPQWHVTLDATALNSCNKVLCTSTTLLNDSLDAVLRQCTAAEHISVLGPSAGYFPDPLFERGVHVLGGRIVTDGLLLLKLISERQRWGAATEKLCFEAGRYQSIVNLGRSR